MILRVLRALPGAASELAADVARALTIDADALAEWYRAEELADRLREAEARARRMEADLDRALRRWDAASKERDEARRDATTWELQATIVTGCVADARGQTIQRLQNRLARWKRRCRRLRDRQRPTGGPIVRRNKGAAGHGG